MDEIDYLSGDFDIEYSLEDEEIIADGGYHEEDIEEGTSLKGVKTILGAATAGTGVGVYSNGAAEVVGSASGEIMGAGMTLAGTAFLASGIYDYWEED